MFEAVGEWNKRNGTKDSHALKRIGTEKEQNRNRRKDIHAHNRIRTEKEQKQMKRSP